jgi:lipopolysaccharide exporter
VSATRSVGDVVMTVVSVLLAALGWGGAAIVAGNAVRALVKFVIFLAVVNRREWLEPCRVTRVQVRALLGFGVPLAIGAVFAFASRRWDNLLVSRFFGPGPAGMYNLAYNLADVPAIQVGEQVGDVLLPSFARLDPERRPAALLRSLTLLGLIVFPLAVGLGVIAPTLIETLLDPRWHPVAPMLLVLSALSITRPIGWTITTYLQARLLTRRILWLEAFKFGLLVVAMLTLGRLSPLWACLAVGVAFGLHTIASLWVVARLDDVRMWSMLTAMAAPLAACLPMALAVIGIRRVIAGAGIPKPVELIVEVLVGGLVYVVFAFTVARAPAKDLLERLLEAIRRRPDPLPSRSS